MTQPHSKDDVLKKPHLRFDGSLWMCMSGFLLFYARTPVEAYAKYMRFK